MLKGRSSPFIILCSIFVGSLVISEVLAAKIVAFYEIYVPAGVLAYAVTFTITDIIGEVWGKDYAKQVVFAGFLSLVVIILLIWIATLLPAAPFWKDEDAFTTILGIKKGAKEVAARENISFASEDVPVGIKRILWDMVQDRYRSESNRLSHIIQEELCKAIGLEDRGVKSAPFYVLRGAAMPATLVEVCFISNPWEEKSLRSDDFKEKIAWGIFNGIKRYLQLRNEK